MRRPAAVSVGRKGLWRLAWVIAALLLCWLAATFGLPALVKSQTERRASEALGRSVTLRAVEFKPWTLELTLHDLAVAGAASDGPPLLTVARIRADAELRSLRHMAPVLAALDVEAPKLQLTRLADGRYDVDDVLERLAARAAGAPAQDEPARFALYNLRLVDGMVAFEDRPVARTHRIDGLALELPFLSNLPAHVEVKVAPRLALRLNGARFDSGAQATPFAERRAGTMQLRVPDLDLAPYLAYLSPALPVRVERGRAALALDLRFEQAAGGEPSVFASGHAALRDAVVTLPDGQPLLAFRALEVPLLELRPLARRIGLGAVRLDAPQFTLARGADGRLTLPQAPSGAAGSQAAAAPAWQVQAESFEIVGGALAWHDQLTLPASRWRLDALALSVQRPAWPMPAALPVELRAELRGAEGPPARLAFEGEVGERHAQLALNVDELALAPLAPYLSMLLRPRVEGALSLGARLEWAAEPRALRLAIERLDASGLALVDGRAPAAALKGLSLADAQVDLMARRVRLGRVVLDEPALRVERARNGAFNFEGWTVSDGTAREPAAPGSAWQVAIDELSLDGGRLEVVDAVPAEPVHFGLTRVRVGLKGFDSAAPAGTMAKLRADARLVATPAATRSARGGGPDARIDWRGEFGLAPLAARGTLAVERLPLALFEPYVADRLNIDLVRADAGFKGQVSLRQDRRGLTASARGDAVLADVRVQTRPDPAGLATPDELLNWQALAVKGLRVSVAPGSKPRVEVAEAELNDFFSRLVITEAGRFNLQSVAAPVPQEVAAQAPEVGLAFAPPTASAAASASEAPGEVNAVGDGLPIDLLIGETRLVNGRVDFSDRFIRPNYSAQLTELNGRLGRLDSGSREMATIELTGRAAGTALLDIRGALNPTAEPLALDIQAKATDLELAPLSPYAGKYAGYAIERGKLSMSVAYRIDPDGKLDAKNQVVLNQLTFGERIESADATKLPVLLAVALLKDRHGVIDIDLPVSGSIDDPQFSVFGIVLKVIGNLLAKAITAPFALLAGGGADDLSVVEFAPGSARPADDAQAVLAKVAQALIDRPSLKMTVTGAADPVSEREAVRRAALEARLLAAQRRELLRAGAETGAPVPVMSAEDRKRLLRELYRQTELPGKPRNLLGMQKDVPAEQMEAMLLAATVVGEDAARELALQRGLAVRDSLIAKGLPSERLFLAAPKLRVPGEDDASWAPRVQLVLSSR